MTPEEKLFKAKCEMADIRVDVAGSGQIWIHLEIAPGQWSQLTCGRDYDWPNALIDLDRIIRSTHGSR